MIELPKDFSWKDYLQLNKDLTQDCSYEIAKHHYIHYGYYENRRYKRDSNDTIDNNNDNNINILVVIVSCNKHWHLWDQIKSRTNNNLIIITGSNKNEKWYDKNNKILYLNCNDLYDGLPEKIILMIDEVLNNAEFADITHIIKIDDHDNYFSDETIKKLYNHDELHLFHYLGQKKNCWGDNVLGNYHFGKVPTNSYWHNRLANVSNVEYFDGGCSYILSRKAMKIINEKYNSSNINELRKDEIYEDIMIGRILQSNNIKAYQFNYDLLGDK